MFNVLQLHTLRHSDTNMGEVNSVAISPDGKLIVSGGDDSRVKIWDVATGANVSSFVQVR